MHRALATSAGTVRVATPLRPARRPQTLPVQSEPRAEEEAKASEDPPAAPTPDIWARMRPQFRLAQPHLDHIRRETEWFRNNQNYLDRVAERSRDFLPYIVREAERRGLPIELTLIPVIESAFQPFAYSPARASGLWQFIPSTARLHGLRINWWYDGRRDLIASTSAAFDYLEELHQDFDGDWLLAAAAYNWGKGNIGRALARNRKAGKALDFWSLKVPAETRGYVPRWLAICDIVARPDHYGVTLPSIPDEVTFRVVELHDQMDLALAAELADMHLDQLYRLNAGYRRWATEPEGPHRLLIPAANTEIFFGRINAWPAEQNVAWRHHLIVAGDTLGQIAKRYGTSVASLVHHNRLDGDLIRAGEHLLVPKGLTSLDLRALSPRVRSALAGDRTMSTPARRHHVRAGESLWLIARRYHVPVADLIAWNRLDPETLLMPGQILELRETGSHSPSSTARITESPQSHVVRNGDSLWNIARRHGVSVADLLTWNDLDPEDLLLPGQTLEVTPPRDAPDEARLNAL